MLNYEKQSKSTRTRTAILLLLLFMVLAIADLFISFFGGVVLGVLLMQFELEVLRFFNRSIGSIPAKAGFISTYKELRHEQKMMLKAGLQVLVTILMLAGVLHPFWGGLVSGVLLTVLTDDLMQYRRQRRKERATKLKH